MSQAFKKVFSLASGATAAVVVVAYTEQLYKMNKKIDEADVFTMEQIHKAYTKLQKVEDNNSLLKKNLTPNILRKLESKKTKLGASLLDVIRPGCNDAVTDVGILAPDTESYKKFALLFDGVIEDYHGFKPTDKQPAIDLGEDKIHEFPPLDPQNKYIRSIKICCARCIAGYPFNPLLSSDDYMILEQKIKNALGEIEENDLKGIYLPLSGISQKMEGELRMSQILFERNKQELELSNGYNFWPAGRGIFRNKENTFIVWVNEQDHVTIISKQNGSNVGAVLDRINRGLKALEKNLKFAYDDRLGYLSSCPCNLGSAVHAFLEIRLPNLTEKSDFLEICDNLGLAVSFVGGNKQYATVSNKRSLGLTQYQAIKQVYDGVKELIRLEESN